MQDDSENNNAIDQNEDKDGFLSSMVAHIVQAPNETSKDDTTHNGSNVEDVKVSQENEKNANYPEPFPKIPKVNEDLDNHKIIDPTEEFFEEDTAMTKKLQDLKDTLSQWTKYPTLPSYSMDDVNDQDYKVPNPTPKASIIGNLNDDNLNHNDAPMESPDEEIEVETVSLKSNTTKQQPTEETAISFKRGEVVLRSQPFTYVLEAQFRTSVCDYCLQQCQDNETMKGKRCSACKIVYYCNTSCQKKAWFNHHREECICLRKVSSNILQGQIL